MPKDTQSYCHSVCEGQTYRAYVLSQPLPFFFLSKTNQGQHVLLSVCTERLMTRVQAAIPPPPLWPTVACTSNNARQGERRQQGMGVQVQKSIVRGTNTQVLLNNLCVGSKICNINLALTARVVLPGFSCRTWV